MSKSEEIDRISLEYKIEVNKINTMNITPWGKLALLAAAGGKAIAQVNIIRSTKEQDKLNQNK